MRLSTVAQPSPGGNILELPHDNDSPLRPCNSAFVLIEQLLYNCVSQWFFNQAMLCKMEN